MLFGQEPCKRFLQPFGKKLYNYACENRRNNRSLSCSDNSQVKKQERKQDRQNHTAHVKSNLHIAEVLVYGIGNGFDKGLAGIHNHIGYNRKRNSKAEDYDAGNYHGESHRIRIYRDKGYAPHAEIGEIAKQKRNRYLQQLERAEFFP